MISIDNHGKNKVNYKKRQHSGGMNLYYLQDSQAPISAIELYNNLCERIITVDLTPGTKISENAISAEYGVSRSVLRTAFARLQQINFIAVYPQRGTYVSLLDMERITSAATIRHVIERNAVYDIIINNPVSELLISDLQEMLSQMQAAVSNGEPDWLSALNTINAQYHLRIVKETMSENALSLLYEIRIQFVRWCNIDAATEGLAHQIIKQDQDLLGAIKNRKLQKALTTIREHFQLLISNEPLVREKYPEYFKLQSRSK